MTEEIIRKAENTLRKHDPVLEELIKKQKLKPMEPRGDYFHALSSSIISQQISVKAAEAIFARFKAVTNLVPSRAIAIGQKDIKLIGLSQQKAKYIVDLAQHFVTDPNVYNHLEKQTDEEVIAELTEIKGIGKWTAQMFLIFTLARPDVFAPDDVGLQRGMMKLFGWSELPAKQELNKIAERWQPYRSVVSLHLWHSIDTKPA
jgi:DNA-3-methyladenine glycosylase II